MENVIEIPNYSEIYMTNDIVRTIVIALVIYFFMAIGLSKIANRLGEKKSWMAWIPFCNIYLLGKLSFNKIMGWIFASLNFIAITLDSISLVLKTNDVSTFIMQVLTIINFILALTVCILYVIISNRIYKKFSKNTTTMTIFTIISLNLLLPFFLFAIRNNKIIKTKVLK
jgi:hypothetical protein